MKLKWFLLLVPFLFLFLRQDLVGVDSYAYALNICGLKTLDIAGYFVFSWLPCNILVWKTLLFSAYVAFVIGSAYLARAFTKKQCFNAVLVFVGLSPLILFSFFKFENEIFALPLMMWATYFFFKAKLEDKPKHFLTSVLLIVLSGFIWEGTYFFALALGLAFLPLFVGSLLALFFVWDKVLFALTPSGVLESWFGGISPLWLLVLVVPFGLLLGWSIGAPLVVGLLFGFFNPKLLIIILPFLLIACVKFLGWLEEYPMIKQLVIVLAVVQLIGFGFVSLTLPPTQDDWLWIEEGIELSEETGFRLVNDWSPGYWVLWKGGQAVRWGGPPDLNYSELRKPFVVITSQELGCELVKDFSGFFVNRRIYECST